MKNSQSDIKKHKFIGTVLSITAATMTLIAPTTSIAFINSDKSSTPVLSLPTPSDRTISKTSSNDIHELNSAAPMVVSSASKPIKTTPATNNQNENVLGADVQINSTASGNPLTNQGQLLAQAHHDFERKEYAKAFKIYSELADAGNPDAQAQKGEMLWYGDGIATDPIAAKDWLAKAANQGHKKAQEFIKMFAARANRQAELNFYTTNFDGGSLKWKGQVCEASVNEVEQEGNKNARNKNAKIEAILGCYNNYIASIKHGLESGNYLPADLNYIMRNEEIEKSKQLAKTVLFKQGLQAKSDVENRLASITNQTSNFNDYKLELIQRDHEVLRTMNRQKAWTMVDGTPVPMINSASRYW